MPPLIIFDDDKGDLGPITDLRASFEVRTGMLTTAGRIEVALGTRAAGLHVPARLAGVVGARAGAPVNETVDAKELLLVNGRWMAPDAGHGVGAGEALVEAETGDVVVTRLRRADAEAFLTGGALPDSVKTSATDGSVLYRYPWDLFRRLAETITGDIIAVRVLDAMVPDAAAIIGPHPVEVHETAIIHPHVVLDAELGPIVLHEHAVVRPNAVICGPCSIGPRSTVVDHALIKPSTVLGPVCKVGGEVGATIFQGFANKTHDGHLGDSWVGKWVNFGAGTTNSNLLNTYDEIVMRVEPDGPRRRTGRTFLGTIVGDHVKTAINTRLMTGTVLGTGAMIATTAAPPTTVRRFAWLTDDGERTYKIEKFLDAMGRVMARRGKEPGEAYVAAVRALHQENAKTLKR